MQGGSEAHNEVWREVKDNLERLMCRRADEDALDPPLYPRVLALPEKRGPLLPCTDDEQQRSIQGARSVHGDLWTVRRTISHYCPDG